MADQLDALADLRSQLQELKVVAASLPHETQQELQMVFVRFGELRNAVATSVSQEYQDKLAAARSTATRLQSDVSRLQAEKLALSLDLDRVNRTAKQRAELGMIAVLNTTKKRVSALKRDLGGLKTQATVRTRNIKRCWEYDCGLAVNGVEPSLT